MESNQGRDEVPRPSNYSSWKECFHEKVQQRCLSLQETKVKLVQAQKAEEAKVRRREPGDWLAREWYNEEKETLNTRIYLLDSLLPTLIPGVENLLMEVERNHVLVSDQEPTRFNPINYLGEYLMRHNPQYIVPPKPGPYLREMKVVSEELKSLKQGTTSQRLAQMRAEAKNRREEREEMERQRAEETARRKEVLTDLFKEWIVDGRDRIPAALVQSAMRFFPDVTDVIPEDMRKATHDRMLKILNMSEKTVRLNEFTKLVLSYIEYVSSDKFQEIMEYLLKCFEDFQEATKHDTRRQIFTDLFHICDYRKVGALDRQKILALLRDFYDRSPVTDEGEFWNPREWPIIELQDINLMDFWGSLGDQEVCEELSENLVLSQTEISEGEILGNEPVDDDSQGTDRMSSSVAEGVVEEMGTSEAETGGISKEENEGAEPSGAEESKQGEDAVSAVESTGLEATDLDGDTIHSEKSCEDTESHEDTKTEREAEPGTVDGQDEALPESASAGSIVTTDGEPGSGKPEESILGREPEMETKPEGDCTSAREPGSEEQVSQEDSGVTETAPEATTTASGDRAMMDTDVTDSQQDAPAAEPVEETPASNESQSDQQPTSETRLQDEELLHGQDSGPSVAEIQNSKDSCTKSSFAASCLTLPQFVQLMDNFVGEDIPLPTVKRLAAFIKGEYKQTKEEKMKQLEKAHHMAHMAQRKQLLEALFEKWDSNACGSLDLEEVVAVLSTFQGDVGKEALMKAKEQLCSQYPQLSRVGKLSPKAFQTLLELIASKFTGNEDETIDNLVRFLTTSVEQSHTKSLQSSARRKWLQDIQQAAETSGTSMEPVYKAVIKALTQDMEAHGDNKRISAYIALLEENKLSPEQGQAVLRYVACTADDAPYVLNQVLHRDMKGVSFAAVDQGKPIYVPRVQHHGNIHFWNPDQKEERKGSLLVLPLYDAHWRVFGILGLDTLQDQSQKSIFLTHEITFYEGVCHAFSKAYHHICMRENVLQVAVTALDWLYPRTPSIHTVTTYLVTPGKDKNYALCRVITTDNTGQKEIHSSPVVLLRNEDLLRDYLFKCTDSSEVTLTSVYGEHHIAVPLHDLSRKTLGIFDISIGQHKKLPCREQKDLQKMLKMAQAACSEILQRSLEETQPTQVLEAERAANVRHAGILFHRFMLQELRECFQKLNAESFAGIKSCAEPPALVHDVVKAVLLLLHPDWKGSEETESWNQCKLKLDDNLIQEVYCFDPTASSVQVKAELLLDLITGVPQAAEWQQNSAPAEYLYQWLHTCLALVEITKSQRTGKNHP